MLSGLLTYIECGNMNRRGFIATGLLVLLFVVLLVVLITGMFLVVLFPLIVGGLFAWMTWNRTRSLLLSFIVFVLTSFIVMRLM